MIIFKLHLGRWAMYIFQTNQTEATMNNQFKCHLQRYLFSLFQLSGAAQRVMLSSRWQDFWIDTETLINYAVMGREQFLIYTGVIFLVLTVTHAKPPLDQIMITLLVKLICQKLLNHLCAENVIDINLIIVYKIYFLSVLLRCWSKREH